jgi:hypothetical protein
MSFPTQTGRLLVTPAILAMAATGCALLGPASIRNGRAAYSDAIVATNSQQVLGMMVRMRYGEPSGLLAVSSVTANLHVQASAGTEIGVGEESNYSGNLVPLTAGVAYEENPTISYTPVQGEKYMRQLLSPLPIDLTVLLFGALGDSPQVMTLLVRSINGIQNPDFLIEPSSEEAVPRFERIVKLFAELSRGGHLAWAQEASEPASYAMALTGEGESYAQQVEELYGLLGFAAPRDLDGVLTLPVYLGIGKPGKAAIQLRTRSLYGLFTIAAASVEVPEEHVQSGLAQPLPPAGPAGRSIRIRGSKGSPGQAMIAIKRHGWWYFIDGTDAESKLTFRVLEALMSVRMAETAQQTATPILTVPVSR